MLAREPYRPPRVRDIANAMDIPEAFVRRLMHMAARRGDLDEIAHDHFFLRSTVQKMAEIAIDIASQSPSGKFTAAEFRDRLQNGRKVAIQILEFFDRHGFTIRRQDLRRINPARVEFFAPKAPDRDGGVPLPVERPDFKSGWGRQTVPGGFDSHPPPPSSTSERMQWARPRKHSWTIWKPRLPRRTRPRMRFGSVWLRRLHALNANARSPTVASTWWTKSPKLWRRPRTRTLPLPAVLPSCALSSAGRVKVKPARRR